MVRSCCDTLQPAPWAYGEAFSYLMAQARPITESCRVPLEQALGRVLAEPVRSRMDVPPWDNSAVDGFAVNSHGLARDSELRVAQRIPAGALGGRLEAGTAARIFTGAPLPAGADAVVMQEFCERRNDRIRIGELPEAGENVRRAGEDIRKGEAILAAGTRLAPQHIGLAASVGLSRLSVYRPLRVAVFSSGDELVMPGHELGPGQIYNSNSFTLGGLVRRMGCEVIQLGMVEDSLEATCEVLARGAREADLILASGGVSVGEEDHVKPAVERLGSLDLWKIAVRPGKPIAYGQVGGTPFIGAPGNPVSLFVTFCIFMRPFLLRMQGVTGDCRPFLLKAVADFEKPADDPRQEYARGRLERDELGRPLVRLYPNRSSGVLSSVTWANGLAVLPPMTAIQPGDSIDFMPFSELTI